MEHRVPQRQSSIGYDGADKAHGESRDAANAVTGVAGRLRFAH
ncbi:hypothetical protein [Nocardia sp. AG03]|nr:hypothetical protein [Nocardia sp. AG03]